LNLSLGLSNTAVAAACYDVRATATPTPAERNQENTEKNSRLLRGPISRMGLMLQQSIAPTLIRHCADPGICSFCENKPDPFLGQMS